MPNKKTVVRSNSTSKSTKDVQLRAVTFAELWTAYPEGTPYVDPKTGNVPKNFENQCAIRLSVTLHKVGIEMTSFRGKGQIRLNGRRTAVLASEMADWLKRTPVAGMGPTENVTGADWQQKIKGRTGIIAFKNYWQRDGESRPSGGHIDLWDGAQLTSNGIGGAISNFLRFTMGLTTGFGRYSDLGRSTEIVFWEIK
jgi:hypothetical protein